MHLNIPILFLVFNRPVVTRQVFNVIRLAQPRHLYISADGPRLNRPDDADKCKEVQQIVAQVDWPCEVKTLIRNENLGCKHSVSQGIDWFFAHVEEGIILEDDTLPRLNFFEFCDEMLSTYRNDKRVMMISGLNINGHWKDDQQAYNFSNFGGIWGWASWRRAWKYYDVNISAWKHPETKALLKQSIPSRAWKVRKKMYDDLYHHRIDTWDLQWGFCKLIQNGLNIIPANNLIKNIGCGVDATHTYGQHPWANLPVGSVPDLPPPPCCLPDKDYDALHLGLRQPKNPGGIVHQLSQKYLYKCINSIPHDGPKRLELG